MLLKVIDKETLYNLAFLILLVEHFTAIHEDLPSLAM
jgi:hypothetical protein